MSLLKAESRQNALSRMASLPLVNSAYNLVSSVYANTKENHPYLRSVCEVAEKGVVTITAVALTRAMPIFQKMQPQISVANNYACIGLDKIEERLPIFYQPSDKIVSRASDIVVGAKAVLSGTVTGAKDTVAHTITGVLDRTKEAVNEGVEMSKSVVNGGINTVLTSHVVKIVNHGVESALTKSETLVDEYFPLTEEDLAEEAADKDCTIETLKPNCYVRLGSLSTKVRKRAYQRAISGVQDAKLRSQEAISQLHHTVDLIEYARKNMNSANQKLHDAQEKLYQSWLQWKENTGHGIEQCKGTEDVESRTLAITRNLAKNLQTTCSTMFSSIQGLPHNIQRHACHMSMMAGDLYQNFHLASFREVSDSLLATTKEKLDKMMGSLDDMVDYIISNTPLNWLVPDFTITDMASESDMEDIWDFDEEHHQHDFVHINGHVNSIPRSE
ncbi:perilipin-2-like [Ambystoma mexicanum]|uniref:perilipin-2-like n=1 Tax=Ambystoma mexicanum TaxID=8296 RepID=UPI0037E81D7F